MKRGVALGLMLLALLGCGRVGAPVRRQPAPPPAPETAVEESEEDAKEKKP